MIIQILYFLTTVLFLLGQMGRMSFLNQHINIYLYEIPFILTLLAVFVKYKFEPLKYFAKIAVPMGIFALITLYGLTAKSDLYLPLENGIALLYYLRLMAYLFAFPYLIYYFMHEVRNSKLVKKGSMFLVVLIITSAIIQYLFYPNLRNLMYLGWDPHLFRVFGIFFEPYLAAVAFGMIFYYLLEFKTAGRASTILIYILIALTFVLLLLTFSRTAYLAFAGTTILYIGYKKKWIYVGLFFFVFALVILFLPKPEGVGINLLRTFSIFTRIENTKQGIEVWRKNPIFGVGYNRIGFARSENRSNIKTESSHAGSSFHSSFITILASTGVVGLIFFVIAISSLASLSLLSGTLLIFISLVSFGDNALLHPFTLFLLMQFIAASYISHPSHR